MIFNKLAKGTFTAIKFPFRLILDILDMIIHYFKDKEHEN